MKPKNLNLRSSRIVDLFNLRSFEYASEMMDLAKPPPSPPQPFYIRGKIKNVSKPKSRFQYRIEYDNIITLKILEDKILSIFPINCFFEAGVWGENIPLNSLQYHAPGSSLPVDEPFRVFYLPVNIDHFAISTSETNEKYQYVFFDNIKIIPEIIPEF